MWLQCCQAKLVPSGAVRAGPSIQTPHGQVLHARISAIVAVPSGVTRPLGVPRFRMATVRAASAVAGPPATSGPAVASGPPGPAGTSMTASARSSATARIAAASPPEPSPATISTGRSAGPRRSALAANASARLRAAGTQTRADPVSRSCPASAVA